MILTLRLGRFAIAMLLVASGVDPARAQDAGAVDKAGVSVFEPAYFATTAPSNALEMLERVPGFTLAEPDAEVRGYAGAQGNVLIDGTRPTSKREDLSEILKRIPATSVERIELLRDGASGADMAGHALLANVIRRRRTQVDGAMQAGWLASTDGWLAPSAQFEYSRRSDAGAVEISGAMEPDLDDDSGRGRIRRFSPSGPVRVSDLDTKVRGRTRELTTLWQPALAHGELTVNVAVRAESVTADTSIQSRDDAADFEIVAERERSREAELALRYVRKLGDRSGFELMASRQRASEHETETSIEGDGSELFELAGDSGETIVRAQLKHDPSPRLGLHAAAEMAENFLRSEARLREDDVAVPLPGSEVEITEHRAELSFGLAWKPGSEWTLEADLRTESSVIEQSGDSPLKRAFLYLKPRLALRWSPGGNNQWRWSLSREVGQLDFGDFVASASLDSDAVSAGNAQLAPDRTLRMTTSWERRLGAAATATLTWTHDRISDVVDRVLVVTADDSFDAPGNIGDGRRDSLGLEFSTALDGLGLRGAHLRGSLLWRTSRVTDPVTGQARGISAENPFEGTISFSHDLPRMKLKWGVEFEHLGEREIEYRFDRVSRDWEDAGWTAFIQRDLGKHWRLRVEATDLGGRRFQQQRDHYDGARSSTGMDEIETRERRSPGSFSLTLRRSTGD